MSHISIIENFLFQLVFSPIDVWFATEIYSSFNASVWRHYHCYADDTHIYLSFKSAVLTF